jgi:hypothetical protein
MNQHFNGRVNILQPNTNNLFNMYDKIPSKQITSYRNPTTGIFDNTPLITEYFSKNNIEKIQNGILQGVYHKSNNKFKISYQDEDTLKIIMRSIYLQYSVNRPTQIDEQIQCLNNLVLDYCVEQVYNDAKTYIQYLYDASTLVVPMTHPVLSYSDDKQLEFKGWFN